MLENVNNSLMAYFQNSGIPLWIYEFIKMIVVAVVVLIFLALQVLVVFFLDLRKIHARFQCRLGPMRVAWPANFHGWAQPIADGIKLLLKEDVVPAAADVWVFRAAPVLAFVSAYLIYITIPFSENLIVRNYSIGILYMISISGLTVVAIFLAGFGSNNKYSLFGAARSAAQMISYEIPLVLSIVAMVMVSGSLSMQDIVYAQEGTLLGFIPNWNIFRFFPFGFFAFFIYITTALAELNRTPFDIPEAESELVAGYNTEYSGMKFAFFFLAEYANMFSVAAIAVTLFLGGWRGPFLPDVVWFILKASVIIFLYMWVRWSLPRFRVDQLMNFGWKFLLPLSLVNIFAIGLWMVIKS